MKMKLKLIHELILGSDISQGSDSDLEDEGNKIVWVESQRISQKLDHIAYCTNEYYETYITNLQNNNLPIPVYISKQNGEILIKWIFCY